MRLLQVSQLIVGCIFVVGSSNQRPAGAAPAASPAPSGSQQVLYLPTLSKGGIEAGIVYQWCPTHDAIGADCRIRMVSADGTVDLLLTDFASFNPRKSPDGKHIAFEAQFVDQDGVTYHRRIWLMDSNGAHQTELPVGDAGSPLWGPNSTQLVFAGSGGTYRSNLDGSQLTFLHTLTDVVPGYGQLDQWSPSGLSILYTFFGGSESNPPSVYVKNLDGSPSKQVVPPAALPNSTDAWGPRYSPDSSQIAFLYSTKVATATATGNNSTPLASLGLAGGMLTWSPDGTRLAIGAGAVSPAPGVLYVVTVPGGQVRQIPLNLTTDTIDHPTWSPDGTRIAFVTGQINHDLYAVDLDGSGLIHLASNVGPSVSGPQWALGETP